MNIALITIVMFLSMMLLLLTGRQVFVIIGAVGTIAAAALWGSNAEILTFTGGLFFMKWYPIVAVPAFIFMGLMLSKSGVADKLYQAVYLIMGPVRGGLAMADIGFSCLIAAMSGTQAASLVTSTTIALPQMFKRKYDKQLVLGEVLAGGSLGFLIPPSVILILYGLIAKVSIGHLWLAAFLPGALLAGMYITYIGVRCHFQPHLGPALPAEERVGLGMKFRSLKAGIAPILLIFAVLGLLFLGVTTITECAAIGAVGSIVIAAINRTLSWKMIRVTLDETLQTTVMIMWIFAAAILFGAVFDGLGAIHAIEPLITMAPGGRWGAMIVMQLTFLALGTVLDDTALLLIVAPLYIPLVAKLGFSLVWYGILYVVNMQAAFMTPPFGYSLFMMKGLLPVALPGSKITMGDIYKSILPFVGIQILCIGLLMVFPQIALWLPGMIFGK
ncbi:TRAP transporter large permease subunit [Chloroflexota bacterium]